ncbi:hypothetical protein FRB97_006279 [Tulasnella sp. 331]|nr:hypothetical protein FRB97_006279 [Tulasnella sp. 331]
MRTRLWRKKIFYVKGFSGFFPAANGDGARQPGGTGHDPDVEVLPSWWTWSADKSGFGTSETFAKFCLCAVIGAGYTGKAPGEGVRWEFQQSSGTETEHQAPRFLLATAGDVHFACYRHPKDPEGAGYIRYIGCTGDDTKRRQLEKWFEENGDWMKASLRQRLFIWILLETTLLIPSYGDASAQSLDVYRVKRPTLVSSGAVSDEIHHSGSTPEKASASGPSKLVYAASPASSPSATTVASTSAKLPPKSLSSKFFESPTDTTLRNNIQSVQTARKHILNLEGALGRPRFRPLDIWRRYITAQRDHIAPLRKEVHQEVLRKCVLPSVALTPFVSADLIRRYGWPSKTPHRFEYRLRGVLDNMKEAGYTPALEDYNFVLKHYAATGHYQGAMEILRELEDADVRTTPNAETFRYCFQALAFHATLPVRGRLRGREIVDLSKACRELMETMEAIYMDFPPAALDALVKIHCLSMDLESLERVLRLGYGVDLSNPDRHPNEYLERQQRIANQAIAQGNTIPAAPALTTALLNAIIIALGRAGQVPKMVTAYEVITRPLPLPSPISHSTSLSTSIFTPLIDNSPTFDPVEDDDPVFHDHLKPLDPVPRTVVSPPSVPHPNSYTYEQLIKWSAYHEYPVICKHYFLAAVRKDRKQDAILRSKLYHHQGAPKEKASTAIGRPTVAVSESMFRYIFLYLGKKQGPNGRRRTNVLAWLLRWTKEAAEWKKADIAFFRDGVNAQFLRSRGAIENTLDLQKLDNQAVAKSEEELDGEERIWRDEEEMELSAALGSSSKGPRKPFNILFHVAHLAQAVRQINAHAKVIRTQLEGSEDGYYKKLEQAKEEKVRESLKREAHGLRALRRSFTWDWSHPSSIGNTATTPGSTTV